MPVDLPGFRDRWESESRFDCPLPSFLAQLGTVGWGFWGLADPEDDTDS